jgi:CubicO group peptidase (beta-lactamase class C family)
MRLGGILVWSSLIVGQGFLIGCSPPWQARRSSGAPAEAAWDTVALARLGDYVQSQKTTGFLIVHDRNVVYERNWPLRRESASFAANFTHGTDAHGALQEDIASAQKSVVAILAGIAIDRGLLDVSKPVSAYFGLGWSNTRRQQEKLITVHHLLEMNSGLTESLNYEAPAGTKFFYNTPAYAILLPVLEKVSHETLDRLTRRWLTEPLGMSDTLWRRRNGGFGRAGNVTGLFSTPRDMARLGQLVLDEGRSSDGRRVISAGQLTALFQPSTTNAAYGRLWWLNHPTLSSGSLTGHAALIAAAPADLVLARGAHDRRIYILPSGKLVVVRTGQAAPDERFDQQLWLLLMKAAPEGWR